MSEQRFEIQLVDGKLCLHDLNLDMLFEKTCEYEKPFTGHPVWVFYDWYHSVVYEFDVVPGILAKQVVALEVVDGFDRNLPEKDRAKPGTLLPWSGAGLARSAAK